eukprot:c20217_g1_i4.p1 GENE.c20217_g1_i4~~c20217_g1_i4.p1  ORF type:complete len:618 (+),score=74.39 c20217_g1_i4:565-2418(+)
MCAVRGIHSESLLRNQSKYCTLLDLLSPRFLFSHRTFDDLMDGVVLRRRARAFSMFIAVPIVYLVLNEKYQGCHQSNVDACSAALRKCPDYATKECECVQDYMKCLVNIQCPQSFPSLWQRLVDQCQSLTSKCSTQQCMALEVPRSSINNTAQLAPFPTHSHRRFLFEPAKTDCNDCYKDLVKCQGVFSTSFVRDDSPGAKAADTNKAGDDHGEMPINGKRAAGHTDCFCVEEFMACVGDHDCLGLQEHSNMYHECVSEWKCAPVQCWPAHRHKRSCEFKQRGAMLLLTGALCGVILASLHYCLLGNRWRRPYDSDTVGAANTMWRPCLRATFFGPCAMLWGQSSQYETAALWLGFVIFHVCLASLFFGVYLTPFKMLQQIALRHHRSADVECDILEWCIYAAVVLTFVAVLCAARYRYTMSRIRATQFDMMADTSPNGSGSEFSLQLMGRASGITSAPHNTQPPTPDTVLESTNIRQLAAPQAIATSSGPAPPHHVNHGDNDDVVIVIARSRQSTPVNHSHRDDAASAEHQQQQRSGAEQAESNDGSSAGGDGGDSLNDRLLTRRSKRSWGLRLWQRRVREPCESEGEEEEGDMGENSSATDLSELRPSPSFIIQR